jgi:16S rRNA (guanine966-N2)-methyltransferase
MKRETQTAARNHSVRIIGGHLKRSKLDVLPVNGLRPTPDRVRETVMNWLGPDWSNRAALDCYAGTGAFGFEALSRGALSVQFIEQNRAISAQIQTTIARFSLGDRATVHTIDARTLSNEALASADVIFADPPFNHGLAQAFVTWIRDRVRPHCRLVIESERNAVLDIEGFVVLREMNAGLDRVLLLRPDA